MKNKKIALLPGLSVLLCFCLLSGTARLAERAGGGALFLALAELLSFALPLLLVTASFQDKKPLARRLRPRRFPKGAWGLTIRMGMTIALLSLFLNMLIYQIAGIVGADFFTNALDAPQTGLSLASKLLIVVLLSAVVEETYLRGTFFAAQERIAGTGPCLLISGLVFAMLHGNWLNFIGPLIAGIAYAYLTYIFDSVWPAVIAHIMNNLYYLFVIWMTQTYAPFGIWEYFAAINAILLLLFMYLTLRALERLFAQGRIPHFEKSAGVYDVWIMVRNPGMIAFILAFAAKAILHFI